MIATAKSISYGMAKAEYDENKVINGVKVASEAARQNVYGDNCREIVEEMTDVQRIRSPVRNPFLDIVVTLSEEDCEKITAPNQSEWLVKLFMHDLMTEQMGLSEDDIAVDAVSVKARPLQLVAEPLAHMLGVAEDHDPLVALRLDKAQSGFRLCQRGTAQAVLVDVRAILLFLSTDFHLFPVTFQLLSAVIYPLIQPLNRCLP